MYEKGIGGAMASGMFRCKACTGEVPIGATACMHCGSDPTTGEVREPEKAKAEAKTKKSAGGCCGLIALFVIGLFIWAVWSSDSSKDRPPTPAASASTTADPKGAMVALYRDILAAAKPCDAALATLGEAVKSGSLNTSYQAASAGRDACGTTVAAIDALSAPAGLANGATNPTAEALKVCRGAYAIRVKGFEKTMAMADGKAGPGGSAAAIQDIKDSQSGVLVCLAEFFDAAGKAGVPLDQLQK